nr:g-type lectin s-receptor-like serine/threonine-protein kinase [Quercus suber]
MGCFSFSFFFFICCVFLPSLTFSASISTHSISPDFTASHFQFTDTRGAFLRSQNGTFKATIDAKPPSSKYYFSVVHSDTNIIIWSANRNTPMSSSDKLSLTVSGLIVTNQQTGQPLWATPQFNSDISAMQLSETGNLVLVDAGNNTLWESFAHPTDTSVMGQRIPTGKSLQSAVTDEDMSVGDYRLEVTDRDAVLQWNKMNYWKLSTDPKAVRNSSKAVSLMVMNGTGLYLLASDNSPVVQVALNDGSSSFMSGKLGPDGRFSIVRPPIRSDKKWEVEFAGPFEDCDLPLWCKEIGLCRRKPLGGSCSCLPEFSNRNNGDCMPVNRSLSLPSACTAARNGSQLNSSISYLKFGPGFLILVVSVIIAILWLRKKRRLSKTRTVKLDRSNSSSSAELEMISIPGLPRRFAYEELVAATENFKTLIGRGGFGTVYREMHQQRRYLELADPRLEGRVTSEEVEKLVRIALCCVHEDPALRPSMAHVVGMLEGGLSLGEPRSESLNFLRFYGQRFIEESRMEGSNELKDLGLYPDINATSNSAAGVSYNPMSYISSQQLSGPR